MTAFDRIEPRLPELMAELAPASVPDYFDDMLQQTGRRRQRPAWASLERWLPMDVVARPVALRAPVLRPLLILVLIGLLVGAALALYAGSQRPSLPLPYGPARNGVIVYATADNDIASLDPATGAVSTLIGGADHEQFPVFTNDGTQLAFGRVPAAGQEIDYLAAADGSGERTLLSSGRPIEWWDWSATGDRVLITRPVEDGGPAHRIGGDFEFSMVNTTTGAETPIALDPELGMTIGFFRPGHDDIVYEAVKADGRAGTKIYLGPGDGTPDLREVPIAPTAVDVASSTPDGNRLVYSTWADGTDRQGRIHVVDLEDGQDAELMFDGSAGSIELSPQFSPDARRIVFERYMGDDYRLTIVPADGNGAAIGIGPTFPGGTNGAGVQWSPDGTQLLVGYRADGSVWLLPTDGTPGRQLEKLSDERGYTWQRLAP